MTLSLNYKILLGFLTVVLALLTVTAVAMFNRPQPFPAITGVVIPKPISLDDFSLVDHNNRAFTREDLAGQWHIISYGYTFCPDICPTTLTTLSQVARLIEKDGTYTDVRFLFYTVDPQRDTTERLAEYVTWFHGDFLGLTRPGTGEEFDFAFEQSLGILSVITPIEKKEGIEGFEGYSVSHGVMIYLLDPEGNLQAVFKPTVNQDGTQYFTIDQIYGDYRAIRDYVG